MTYDTGNLEPGPADAEALATAKATTEWAARLTRKSDGGESFIDCTNGPAARGQAEMAAAVQPPGGWDAEVVSRITMTSPWQPTPGLGPDAAQLATLLEKAAETLRRSVYSDSRSSVYTAPLSSEAAAAVVGSLQAALDHIAAVLSPAVSYALPHAARPLDAVATRIGLTADMIGSAVPVIAATAGSTVTFLDKVEPTAFAQNLSDTIGEPYADATPAEDRTASPADAFPRDVRPATPEPDGTEARKTAGPRSRQQVTPRGRGRAG
jgi:hypothetical protein